MIARLFGFSLALLGAPTGPAGPVAAAQSAPAPASAPANASDDYAVTVPTFANATCPVMGKPISSKLFVDTDQGRIWICCKGCSRKILGDVPAAARTAYPRTRKLDNAICPVSGRKVGSDATTLVLQGIELRLDSKECVAKALAETQITLARAAQPDLVDVGNAKCPITGEPVAKNVFCVIGKSIVRLATPDAIEAVKKAPKEALEKAQADARAAAKQ